MSEKKKDYTLDDKRKFFSLECITKRHALPTTLSSCTIALHHVLHHDVLIIVPLLLVVIITIIVKIRIRIKINNAELPLRSLRCCYRWQSRRCRPWRRWRRRHELRW
jgi:hypothetical protein